MQERISWCATMSEEDKNERNALTLLSIERQNLKPFEIITTEGGNIAQGRNKYLQKVKGDYIASFDGGCFYPNDYAEKMVDKLNEEDADIVIAPVRPLAKTLIQSFCATRMPQYDLFTLKDWENFIPSNRQVIFKRSVIGKLGLLPSGLWRSDDTYWYRLAREKGLKFAYCEDTCVYWETKTTIKGYLRTVYHDTMSDYKNGVKPFQAPKKISVWLFPLGVWICFLAMIMKWTARLKCKRKK